MDSTDALRDKFERVERNKDKTDLRRALSYVEGHLSQYQANVDLFLSGDGYRESRTWADGIDFQNVTEDETLQITPDEVRNLFAHVSPELIKLSKLKAVDYTFQGKVIVPGFDEEGNLEQTKITLAPAAGFPADGQHPHRLLIGHTENDGSKIRPFAIPQSISSDSKAIKLYQLHVMLHEFFHTIESTLRSDESAAKVLLGGQRSFADWRRDYLKSLEQEPLLTSEYSEVYRDKIFTEGGTLQENLSPYDYAVCEDQAESFVASHFGIISNPRGYTSFSSEPFGNAQPEKQLLAHGNQSLRAGLMKELRNARITVID